MEECLGRQWRNLWQLYHGLFFCFFLKKKCGSRVGGGFEPWLGVVTTSWHVWAIGMAIHGSCWRRGSESGRVTGASHKICDWHTSQTQWIDVTTRCGISDSFAKEEKYYRNVTGTSFRYKNVIVENSYIYIFLIYICESMTYIQQK